MTRALFFLADFGGGGAQRTLLNLASAMPSGDVSVELAVGDARGPARDWISPGLQYHDLGGRRLAALVPSLTRLIRARAPDIVLSTMMDANVTTALAARLARSKAAIVLRETNSLRARGDIGALRRKLAGLTYRRADLIVALSEGVRRELVDDLGLENERTVTIPNPVAVSEIAERVAKLRQRRTRARNGKRIVAVGRLHRQKGFDVLIDAVADHTPDATLVILGEGPERAKLAQQARMRGLADRVSMPGFVDDTLPYLADADLFVLSSRWEGFGHVIVEAMAAGVPVVATDCPYGPADIIDNEKSGLLVAPENPASLGAAIKRLLSDDALAARLSSQGATAAQRYKSSRVVLDYAAALKEASARRSRTRH